ncbi:MAG: ATP-binding cassette domain-containing protein [Actinomycetota bacterium]
MPTVIEAEGLTKFYGATRGIEDLSFSVGAGEVFGFLGPNGAGKTTTIRLLLDLLRPTRGRVRIFGLDPHDDLVAVHRRVGYLPGELALYERMTGAAYLRMIDALRDERDGRAARLAAQLDLDLTRRIADLSHGNKQKLGLVQAFAYEPDLLVLDEPTQGLDPLVQQEFYALVAEAKARGASILLSSHIMPEVERTCDRVAIIREGSLAAIEDVGSLKARAVRAVEFHFASPVEASVFEGLPGVRDVRVRGDVVTLTVEGTMDAVVKAAARCTVVGVHTREPSLEDVFLAFYGGAR